MPYSNHRMGKQLLGVDNCPHCGISAPYLTQVWISDWQRGTARSDGQKPTVWAAFLCRSCGGAVTATARLSNNNQMPVVGKIYPDIWSAADVIPEFVRNYLNQAQRTIGSPDASVIMSASSIDAMLKDKKLEKGSLFARITSAVEMGIITNEIAEWAHRVRLDSNQLRHADQDKPNLSPVDAQRSFEFAKALADILYVLPSKMPPKINEQA